MEESFNNDEISLIIHYDNNNLINDDFLYFIDKIFSNIYGNEYITQNDNNNINYHIFFEINEIPYNEENDFFSNCKEINNILGKTQKIKKDDILIKNKECCNICFEEYSINTFKRVLPDCKHCFHKKCIDKWLKSKSNCPICRTNLLKN